MEAKRLRPQKNCATMLDLRGREIRVGKMPAGGLKVQLGHIARVTNQGFGGVCTETHIFIDQPNLYKFLKGSDKMSFSDCKMEAQVLEVLGEEIKIKFLEEGVISERSIVKVPSRALKELPVM
jgi:pyruvate kinase